MTTQTRNTRATIEMDFVDHENSGKTIRLPVEILKRQEYSVLARLPGCDGLYDVCYISYSLAYGPHYSAEPSSEQSHTDFERGTWRYFALD